MARPDDQRSAHFTCSLCIAGPEGPRIAVEGHCHGVLLRSPRGELGFGYDPIFVPRECLDRDPPPSFAELDPDTKGKLSHRGRALRILLDRLEATPALLGP
jgi:XTP/dITP diphosphohydrolase